MIVNEKDQLIQQQKSKIIQLEKICKQQEIHIDKWKSQKYSPRNFKSVNFLNQQGVKLTFELRQYNAALQDEIQFKKDQIEKFKKQYKITKIQEQEVMNQHLLDENNKLRNLLLDAKKQMIYLSQSQNSDHQLNQKLLDLDKKYLKQKQKLELFQSFDSGKSQELEMLKQQTIQQQKKIAQQKVQINQKEVLIKQLQEKIQKFVVQKKSKPLIENYQKDLSLKQIDLFSFEYQKNNFKSNKKKTNVSNSRSQPYSDAYTIIFDSMMLHLMHYSIKSHEIEQVTKNIQYLFQFLQEENENYTKDFITKVLVQQYLLFLNEIYFQIYTLVYLYFRTPFERNNMQAQLICDCLFQNTDTLSRQLVLRKLKKRMKDYDSFENIDENQMMATCNAHAEDLEKVMNEQQDERPLNIQNLEEMFGIFDKNNARSLSLFFMIHLSQHDNLENLTYGQIYKFRHLKQFLSEAFEKELSQEIKEDELEDIPSEPEENL